MFRPWTFIWLEIAESEKRWPSSLPPLPFRSQSSFTPRRWGGRSFYGWAVGLAPKSTFFSNSTRQGWEGRTFSSTLDTFTAILSPFSFFFFFFLPWPLASELMITFQSIRSTGKVVPSTRPSWFIMMLDPLLRLMNPCAYIQRNLHDNFEFRRCVITSLMDRGLISFVISCGRFLKEEMINYCFSLRNNNLFFFNHWEIKYWRMKSSIMKNIVIEIITHRNIKIKEY